jgi:hypothetical protein
MVVGTPDIECYIYLIYLTLQWPIPKHTLTILSVSIDGVWFGYWICWHNSELHAIIAPSLSFTLHKSLLQTLRLLQPALPWTAVSW